MEIEACEQSVDLVDLVLMDGSLHSQFMTRQSSLDTAIVKAMKKNDNVIFISKTSNTKKQFERLGSLAGDIFYYNHVTKNAPVLLFAGSLYRRIPGWPWAGNPLTDDSTPIIKL